MLKQKKDYQTELIYELERLESILDSNENESLVYLAKMIRWTKFINSIPKNSGSLREWEDMVRPRIRYDFNKDKTPIKPTDERKLAEIYLWRCIGIDSI